MSEQFIPRQDIQWFPGHMTKTLRMMEADIGHVDGVLQILDARIPLSSLNPEIERITRGKPHLYVLNKADLADPQITDKWIQYFKSAGAGCIAISAKRKDSASAVKPKILQELSELLRKRASKGMTGAKLRIMVVGIPNVGKSTLINTLVGGARAKAADRPGVTRGKQWLSTDKFDFLDMPGVLWKKFESLEVAANLSFIGSIRDGVLDIEELAMGLLAQVRLNYPDFIKERYHLNDEELSLPLYELLEMIGRKRGMLIARGEVNTERAAITIVDEFRGCKWGRISLEIPPVTGVEDFDDE